MNGVLNKQFLCENFDSIMIKSAAGRKQVRRRPIFMEISQNRSTSAIYLSPGIQFENRPFLSYFAENSAIWNITS